MSRVITLGPDERIIAVIPEFCRGPGWANAVAWVYIADSSNLLRIEAIHPDERSEKLNHLFEIGEVICRHLIASVPVKRKRKESGLD